MPTKMKSFRMSEAAVCNLEHLCEVFDCSQSEIIEMILEYSVCRMSDYYEDGKKSDLIGYLMLRRFGYNASYFHE